jgi:cysteinyl-tRNA synthetase
MIKLYNTLDKKIVDFVPVNKNQARIYSCGPTVYNHAHIGNMRAFLFSDLIQRVIRTIGEYEVKWVMNITDIDDKTIRDSAMDSAEWNKEMGEQDREKPKQNLKKFTDYYLDIFLKDIDSIGIKKEHFFAMPRATDDKYIEEMQNLVQKIYDNGYAYENDGSVYFDVGKWRKSEKYGRLRKLDFENMKVGERVDSDEYDRDSASDFVLWKAKKNGEPFWDFKLKIDKNNKFIKRQGRPGWHLECSAMGRALLGDKKLSLDEPFIDIHTGGVDLCFPHHEDEIAQSHAGYETDPVKFWCHNEFLDVEGEKMSKSLGNFFTLKDLVERGYDPMDVRYAIISQHYRTRFNFTLEGITAAKKARKRVQEFIYDLFVVPNEEQVQDFNIPQEVMLEYGFKERVFDLLADDLNTPRALGEIFSYINNNKSKIIGFPISRKKALVRIFEAINEVFGCWEIKSRPEVPEDMTILLREYMIAKGKKDWELADKKRDEILSEGIVFVKDSNDIITIRYK